MLIDFHSIILLIYKLKMHLQLNKIYLLEISNMNLLL